MRTITDITVGETATLHRTIRAEDVQKFAEVSGDGNPLHLDADFAGKTAFKRPVVYGALLASYVSALIGNELPGAGALWADQQFRWLAPVYVGDTVAISMTVTQVSAGAGGIRTNLRVTNQDGAVVLEGAGLIKLVA